MVKALKASSDTFATMDVLRKLPGVDQAILLEVSNNGGVPKPGHKIYTRAIDAKVDGDAKGEKRKDLLDKYDEFRVDQQYIDMVLATKQSQKPYKFETATHENCILRTIYIDRKVAYSEIYHIFSDTRKWRQIILSIQTNDHNERFECKEVRAAIELCVRRIQHNFETWG